MKRLVAVAHWFGERPDVAVAAGVSSFFVLFRVIYLPGLAAGIAWQDFDNPLFYADRFARPELFQHDLWAAYQRAVYPFTTLVHAVPALLLKFLDVPPIYPAFATIALNDLLIVLAVYWLCRALSMDRVTSLVCGLFSVTSELLSWSLAGYPYLGHDTVYAGSFVIPFTVALIPSLIQRRVGIAMLCAAVALLLYPPFGLVALGTIAVYLAVRREAPLFNRAIRWAISTILSLSFCWI